MAIFKSKNKNECWQGCWWECKLVQPLWKAEWKFLKKLKIELPYDPVILLLGICPKKSKSGHNRDTYIPMFTQHYSQLPSFGHNPGAQKWMNGRYIYIYICIL
jgi:hypothetical protein